MKKITQQWGRNTGLALGCALMMWTSAAMAQYVWIDAKGMKQFSDRPPPAGTPQKNILKARNMPTASDPAPAAPATPAVAAKAATPPSLADREADYRKRKTEQAEAEKKAGVEAENAKTKVAACNAARQNKSQLDNGTPIRDTNEERSWLTDQQRADRRAAAQKTINEHCG